MKLVPVHNDDFKKINEFAEAAWIYRDTDDSDNNKEIRRNLLREVLYTIVSFFAIFLILQHNTQVIKTIQEKEEKKNPRLLRKNYKSI